MYTGIFTLFHNNIFFIKIKCIQFYERVQKNAAPFINIFIKGAVYLKTARHIVPGSWY